MTPNPPKHDHWPELAEVQRWFQAVVTHPDGVEAGVESPDATQLLPMTRDELEVMITRSERVSARDRIAIYANAYYARLIECLGETYPVLKRTLGEEVFDGFAFGYLQHYPSRSYTLGHLGDQFPDFLNDTRPDRNPDGALGNTPAWPDFLIDLAHLEWAIIEVFDGPGIENKATLSAADLRDVASHQWPQARLTTAPCLRLLALRFPLNEYYSAARREAADIGLPPPGPAESYIAITRRDYIVRRHDLTRHQYRLLHALQQGLTLSEAIDAMSPESNEDEMAIAAGLQQWFADWTAQQFFLTIEFAGPEA